MNELTDVFELKCKKCGSTNVEVFEHDKYGDCERYLGKTVEIICIDCHRNYEFEFEC